MTEALVERGFVHADLRSEFLHQHAEIAELEGERVGGYPGPVEGGFEPAFQVRHTAIDLGDLTGQVRLATR